MAIMSVPCTLLGNLWSLQRPSLSQLIDIQTPLNHLQTFENSQVKLLLGCSAGDKNSCRGFYLFSEALLVFFFILIPQSSCLLDNYYFPWVYSMISLFCPSTNVGVYWPLSLALHSHWVISVTYVLSNTVRVHLYQVTSLKSRFSVVNCLLHIII